ncbi:type IV pilus twitching motility protein PilT [Aliterella atlantica]|uniref:Twitching motility protein PilT n=1 Tax=Aliterella atlantica CENA595 TaxID=1618023 RepID=A0A0D8ZMQ0_9CYAN|nr:type IV pilus twitching motility protein PilT [Aliterella atlantica]KJH70030.1 twitching motility protein PilT [Aliterella atlantica CENA595]
MTESQRPSIPPLPARQVPPPPPPPRQSQAVNNTTIGNTQLQHSPATNIAQSDLSSAPLPPTSVNRPASPPPLPPTSVNRPASPPPLPPTSAHRPASPPPLPPTSAHRPPTPPQATKPTFGKDVQPTLEKLVQEAYEQGVSDLHLGVSEVPRFRERGHIIVTQYPETDEATFYGWLGEILSEQQIEQFRHDLEYDGATQYEGLVRVRINIFVSLNGPAMVLRLIPLKILTMEQLGLPPVFRDLCHYHKGLILVTGPTGSGKSTTMAAMIDYINKEMPKNIISIEDPVEFVHKSQKSLIKQREVGIHTLKFDNALKASLREDPDIILIGEMRDRETVNTALKAAQTGHLVFGTLHTNSAVKTIERILNLYNPDEQAPMRIQVAESLVAVIAQSLLRTTDRKRAAIHEIMINTDAIKDYIIRNDVEEIESIIPRCNFEGMCTMNQSIYRLYEEGRITEETALEASPKPNEMAQILRGRA